MTKLPDAEQRRQDEHNEQETLDTLVMLLRDTAYIATELHHRGYLSLDTTKDLIAACAAATYELRQTKPPHADQLPNTTEWCLNHDLLPC